MAHALSSGGGGAGQRPKGRANSLGLSDRQLEALTAAMDSKGAGHDQRRRFVRLPFRKLTVDMRINHPGGTAITFPVACRNVSCGGMSILHNTYLYPNSTCVVMLPRVKGGVAAIPGVIVRCAHVQGMVHEVSIRFDKQIQAEEFVERDPLSSQFTLETVAPEALVGTVLYVDESALDQKLIQHYVRATNLCVRAAADAAQAAAVAREGCDVVLCNHSTGTGDAGTVIKAVREVLPDVPIVVVTADTSATALTRVRQLGVPAFLPKPFNDVQLLQALGEFLLMRSPRPGDAPTGGVDDLTSALADFPRRLEASLRDEDAMAGYMLCQQIGSTARSLRMATLARLAEAASTRLAATMSTTDSEQQLRELMAACSPRRAA
jgi:CheY-like chemotaxis protein